MTKIKRICTQSQDANETRHQCPAGTPTTTTSSSCRITRPTRNATSNRRVSDSRQVRAQPGSSSITSLQLRRHQRPQIAWPPRPHLTHNHHHPHTTAHPHPPPHLASPAQLPTAQAIAASLYANRSHDLPPRHPYAVRQVLTLILITHPQQTPKTNAQHPAHPTPRPARPQTPHGPPHPPYTVVQR